MIVNSNSSNSTHNHLFKWVQLQRSYLGEKCQELSKAPLCYKIYKVLALIWGKKIQMPVKNPLLNIPQPIFDKQNTLTLAQSSKLMDIKDVHTCKYIVIQRTWIISERYKKFVCYFGLPFTVLKCPLTFSKANLDKRWYHGRVDSCHLHT